MSTVEIQSFGGSAQVANNTYLGQFVEGFQRLAQAISDQSEQSEANGIKWDRFGSMAVYVFSSYGITTFFVAMILNRTSVIASSARIHTRSANLTGIAGAFKRSPFSQAFILALLRLSSVLMMSTQVYRILVALCNIGQSFPESQTTRLSRMLSPKYFQYDPAVYAEDRYMQMPRNEVIFGPTTDMLWPVFLSVSYSLFIETFASTITNTKPYLEGGITLFELSMDIQEMSSGIFFLRKNSLVKRPSEQLLIVALFSLSDQICNHLGAIFNFNKYRLVPSTVMNLLVLWYFLTSIRGEDMFSFPTEFAITYLGLVVILAITVVCVLIFVLTIVTKGAQLEELNFASFFEEDSREDDFFLRYLGLSLDQDFYSAAINLGMVAVTSTGKASYIMEYSLIPTPKRTWLEQNIWNEIKKFLNVSSFDGDTDAEQSSRLMHFLTENNMSGYGNLITNPSERLITGGKSKQQDFAKRDSKIRIRVKYFQEIVFRFAELLRWLAIHFLYEIPKRLIFRRGASSGSEPESTKEFEARKRRAPAFIRHLLKKQVNKVEDGKSPCASVNVNGRNENSTEDAYGNILSQRDMDEIDDSPDFLPDLSYTEESEIESDTEVKDLTSSCNLPSSRTPNSTIASASESISAISELMTAESFLELIESKDVLYHHLTYEDEGRMTRSRYKASSARSYHDEATKLLDVITSIRQKKQLEKRMNNLVDEETSPLDSRMTCVICQTEPRELITWPCKCFAICEGCRLSLVSKGMEGCVCCRQNVEGVSRVYLP